MRTISIIILSALSGIVLFVSGIFLFSGDGHIEGEVESHIIFYDESYKKSVLEGLDKSSIPYRVDGENSIYFPVKYQKDMDELKNAINSNYPKQFSLFQESMISEFSKRLDEAGVPFKFYDIENGKSFIIENEHGHAASKIFSEIM
ncbi:MAG: hypothetical protein DIZ78_17720 [endosymbiont of Escarpia spicata]|uniref:Uncharacterized protein n=1 Tax=endosymbiont of Escarpia spicata TaxID=2200908 RepID=A0A370D9D1_9GAMM|nr:MAG: hypothetical protein DIZ78_17720 [endosymbiont of Escarpia spicata]